LFKKLNRPVFLADGLASIGQEVFGKKNNIAKALPYIRQALATYQQFHWKQDLDEGHNFDKNLYQIYKALKQPTKALFHLEQYTAQLDTTLKNEIKSGRDIVQGQLDKEKQTTTNQPVKNTGVRAAENR